MNLPIPPTDNLYEFAALSGTIIFLASIFFAETFVLSLEEKADQTYVKAATTKAEIDYIERRVNTVQKIIDSSIQMQLGQQKSDPTKLELAYSQAEVKTLLNEIEELTKRGKIASAETHVLTESASRSTRRARDLFRVSLVSGAFGLLLAGWGYRGWYYKVQVHQDQVLAMQSKGDNRSAEEETVGHCKAP